MRQCFAGLLPCLRCNRFSGAANVDFTRLDEDSPGDIGRPACSVWRVAVSGSQGPGTIWSKM